MMPHITHTTVNAMVVLLKSRIVSRLWCAHPGHYAICHEKIPTITGPGPGFVVGL